MVSVGSSTSEPYIFEKNWFNRTTDMGEICPQNQFFWFNSDGMAFLREKLKSSIQNFMFHKKC